MYPSLANVISMEYRQKGKIIYSFILSIEKINFVNIKRLQESAHIRTYHRRDSLEATLHNIEQLFFLLFYDLWIDLDRSGALNICIVLYELIVSSLSFLFLSYF